MPELTDEEKRVVAKLLGDSALQYMIGAEEWSLTEDEEKVLWGIINRLKP